MKRLADLSVTRQPRLIVFNKMDLYRQKHLTVFAEEIKKNSPKILEKHALLDELQLCFYICHK